MQAVLCPTARLNWSAGQMVHTRSVLAVGIDVSWNPAAQFETGMQVVFWPGAALKLTPTEHDWHWRSEKAENELGISSCPAEQLVAGMHML